MKTQLLQDFNESGSAPAGPPPPSVGQAAAQTGRTPAPAEAAVPRPAAAPRTAQPAPARVQPRGFAPQPPAFANGVRVPEETTAEWSPESTGGDPDWLTERLARDAATRDRSEWNGGWTRHLATWGAAGVLLALLAGGGLWLYEQSQVEGALVVVANTNPAPRVPAIAPVSTSAPVPAAANPAPRVALAPVSADAGVGAAGGLAGAATAAAAGEGREAKAISTESVPAGPSAQAAVSKDADAAEPVREARSESAAPPPKRQRSQSRKRSRTEASAAIPDSQPSARQRREETLMQCRAHGYDDHQCVERGCEMTRYGFACKG